jgi:enoyl-CoA hydratase
MRSFEFIRVDRDGSTAVVTLTNPKALNALKRQLLRELTEALRALDADATVRAIILTGEGEKAFAAGADISEFGDLANTDEAAAMARFGQAVTTLMESLRVPVIVAVNGFALGGGCEIAMGGDIRIASENAKFGQPEVNLGLIPGYGGTQRTARLFGRGMALYLCLTGEMIDAQEALRIGLVQKVVPLASLLDEAKKIATAIAAKAPLAVAATKRAIHQGADLTLAQGLEIEALAFATMTGTSDFREGTTAFLEKRKPEWKGV